jgi:hypothetical protein
VKLEDVQAAAAAALSARAYFTDAVAVPIIEDDGLQDEVIESHLNSTGCVVLVSPLTSGKPIGAGNGVALVVMMAEFFVQVIVNPQKNAEDGGADRNAIEAVTNAIAALNNATLAAGDRQFELADDGINLNVTDGGLLIYDVKFRKRVSAP